MARPPPLQKIAWLVEDKEDQEKLINKEELMTLMPLQHCKGLRTAVALSTASRFPLAKLEPETNTATELETCGTLQQRSTATALRSLVSMITFSELASTK